MGKGLNSYDPKSRREQRRKNHDIRDRKPWQKRGRESRYIPEMEEVEDV